MSAQAIRFVVLDGFIRARAFDAMDGG